MVWAPTAKADPVTFNYQGQVTEVFDLNGVLDGSVVIGTQFYGSYTFEGTWPDSTTGSTRGDYEWRNADIDAGFFFSQTLVGNYGWEVSPLTPDPFGGIIVHDNLSGGVFGPEDGYTVNTAPHQVLGPVFPVDTVRGTPNIGISLSTIINLTAFNSDSLPLVPPNLADFEETGFLINGNGAVQELYIRGTLTSLTAAPPPDPSVTDTCDVSDGPNDIDTVTASYDGDTDEIVVDMVLCADDADDKTTYQVYFDHQGGPDDGPDTFEDNLDCVDTWDDRMTHKGSKDSELGLST